MKETKEMTIETILDILKLCDFSDGTLTDQDFEEKVVYPLLDAGYTLDYSNGVSKCVLIFPSFDYVVKIPFTGSYYDGYSSSSSYYSQSEYSDFLNAKDPLSEDDELQWDYCRLEEIRFCQAKAHGFAKYFAETKCIGEIEDFPIYIQPKAIIAKFLHPFLSAEEQEVVKKMSNQVKEKIGVVPRIMNDKWILDCYQCYGYEQTIKLFTFLHNFYYDGDLHSDNLGYINNKPVLIDYSDFLG